MQKSQQLCFSCQSTQHICRYAECHNYVVAPYFSCRYAECHYVECHNVECYYAVMLSLIMLNVYMLNVAMVSVVVLNVIMPNAIILSVVMLSINMLNVLLLCVVMLSVAAPYSITNVSYLKHVNNVESHAGSGQDGRKSCYDVTHGIHFRRGFLVRRILDVTKKNHLELITREALLRGKDQYR
jgi:hypothetical protein